MTNPNTGRDERVDAEQIAKEFIQRYYNEGAWKDKSDAWLFNALVTTLNSTATRMRDRCVAKVKAASGEIIACRPHSQIGDLMARLIEALEQEK